MPAQRYNLWPKLYCYALLTPGDVLVADRGLCSYAHIALLVQHGRHAVLRVGSRQMVDCTPPRPFGMPATRRSTAIKGLPRSRWIRAVSKDDQRVEWFKPRTCPPWRSSEALEALPPSLVVRALRYQGQQRGCRSRPITLVTTLRNAEGYPCADVAALYRQRWEAETPLASSRPPCRWTCCTVKRCSVSRRNSSALPCSIISSAWSSCMQPHSNRSTWNSAVFWRPCDGSGHRALASRWRPYSSSPPVLTGWSPGSPSGGPKPFPS